MTIEFAIQAAQEKCFECENLEGLVQHHVVPKFNGRFYNIGNYLSEGLAFGVELQISLSTIRVSGGESLAEWEALEEWLKLVAPESRWEFE